MAPQMPSNFPGFPSSKPSGDSKSAQELISEAIIQGGARLRLKSLAARVKPARDLTVDEARGLLLLEQTAGWLPGAEIPLQGNDFASAKVNLRTHVILGVPYLYVSGDKTPQGYQRRGFESADRKNANYGKIVEADLVPSPPE
jgi:hypothetical protein